jgi:hypothetical protein
MARGQLSYGALRALADTRPVLVELDAAATLPLFPFVIPDGLLYRVLSAPPSADAIVGAARGRERAQATLLARVHDNLREPETRKNLLWSRYVEALYYTAHGALPEARTSVRAGLSLAPQTRELVLLERALETAQGAVSIEPFLVHGHTAPNNPKPR